MASITALARVPEILFDIIRYLPSKDILNLGLTSKILLPACYRFLWTNLSLVPAPIKKTWPGLQIRSKFRYEIYKVIWDYWFHSAGLQYTKRVDFDRLLNKDCKESEVLIQLLEAGKLKLSCIDLFITLNDVTAEDFIPVFQRLWTYAESKSLKEFKIQLHCNIVHTFPELVDLAKVTKLALDIPEHFGVGGNRHWVAPNSLTGEKIRELTSILTRTINLTYFSWKGAPTQMDKRCLISAISKDLGGLQTAFTNLTRLKSLKIERYLFHPSFFVIPPKTVKNLVLNCTTSAKWWQDFAACPLTGVKDLRLHSLNRLWITDRPGFFSAEEDISVDLLRLGSVAARDLEISLCYSKPVPWDFGLCLLKGNPKLASRYRTEFARREIKHLIVQSYTRFERYWYSGRKFAQYLYIQNFLNGSKPKTELEIVEEYARIAVLGEITDGNVHNWHSAWARAKNIAAASKSKLEKELYMPDCVHRAIHHYTHVFLEGGQGVDEEEFLKQCTRIFEDEAQAAGDRQYAAVKEAAKQLKRVVNRFRLVFDGLRRKIHNELTQKLLGGLEIDELALMGHWVEKALVHFQDLGLSRLSISEKS